jgi:hypothetical protein
VAISISKGGALTTLDSGEQYSWASTSTGDVWAEIETPPVPLVTGEIYTASIFCSDNSVTLVQYSTFGIEVLPAVFNGVLCARTGDENGANFSTVAALGFDAADVYDTGAAHDPASNNSKIIIPAAWGNKYGIFTMTINSTSVTTSSSITLSVRKGGSNSFIGVGGVHGNPGGFSTSSINCHSCPVLLTAGDEYQFYYWMQDSSVNIQSETTSFGLRLLEY